MDIVQNECPQVFLDTKCILEHLKLLHFLLLLLGVYFHAVKMTQKVYDLLLKKQKTNFINLNKQ